MNEKIEKTANVSIEDMLFIDDIISENKIIINIPLIEVCGNDLTRAAMLTRYVFFYKLNNYQEFSLPDKKMAEYLHTNIKTIERQKRWIKENGLISVRKVGIPAIGFIDINIKKIMESYKSAESSTLKMRELAPLKRGDIYNNIEESYIREKENLKRNTDLMKNNPASGSPSSPDVDELSENISSIKPKKVKKLKDYEKDELFLSTWKTLPEYMRGCGPVKAYKMWVKATEKSTKNVEEIKKAITFYLKTLPEWQHPQHFSTFLNQGTWEEFCARAIEHEHRQEQQPTQTENQKYWEEHENTQVISSKKIEQPKDLERRIGIARKLNLLDRFLPDEYNNEWKFMPKEIKEILVSDAVEKVINDIKSKEESLIQQIACVTMLGREGYMSWKDEYEAETRERPTEDIEFYIPFGKKIQSDIWKWLLKYSHKFGLPSESKIDKVREWYNKKPLGPVWLLFS